MTSKESLVTLCFKTDDASTRDDKNAKFQFAMHADRSKMKPSKISLGSLEFPIVQYSIEEDWSKLYFCESIKITSTCREITFQEIAEGFETTNTATLPLTLNPVKKLSANISSNIVFEFEYDHGLSVNMFNILERENIKVYMIHSSDGSSQLTNQNTTIINSKELSIKSDIVNNSSGEGVAHGFLSCQEIPCPSVLCSILRHLLFPGEFTNFYTLDFNQKLCRATFAMTGFGPGKSDTRLILNGDSLLQRLGYTKGSGRTVQRGVSHASGVATLRPEKIADTMPAKIDSGIFGGFDYISLQTGWYIPSHRPMATGQPLQLPKELDSKLNRFMFLPKDGHKDVLLIFKDYTGRTHIAKIIQGNYTVDTITLEIERAMNDVDKESSLKFIFTFDYCEERFIISSQKNGQSMRIDILFSHPLSIDAVRLGFTNTDYIGYHKYMSKNIHIPRLEWPRKEWCTTVDGSVYSTNTYNISENGPSKQINIDSNSKPSIFGVIKDYWDTAHVLSLLIYANNGQFSHGVQPGDIVHIYHLTKSVKQCDNNDVKETSNASLSYNRTIMAICISNLSNNNSNKSNLLTLYVPDHDWKNKVGEAIGVDIQLKPFNLNFSKEMTNSITGKRLGFQNKVYEWGLDGSVDIGESFIAPYIAPHIHAIDHPDYVLMYIEEGKKGTTIQHRCGNNVTMPFAKIVLYPLFREERMIPKETTLTSGESLTTFTVYFRNPDDTPYHFHGAEFSFTMNFIV